MYEILYSFFIIQTEFLLRALAGSELTVVEHTRNVIIFDSDICTSMIATSKFSNLLIERRRGVKRVNQRFASESAFREITNKNT